MTSNVYDAAVLGLGAMGSAAACHLARRGATVLGIDQFSPPHSQGSSHGETRVIREAYFEHPSYVPLVQRAYELWTELEQATGETLYLKTGGVMLGCKESTVVSGALQSAQQHSLPHELLDAAGVRARFPGLNPNSDMYGVLEPRAGILFPEKCVSAHLAMAAKSGAHLRLNEAVQDWSLSGGEVTILTATNQYHARKLIVSAGAWVGDLFPHLKAHFSVERQVLLWFKALDGSVFTPDRFPIHLWEYERDKMFYGFPDLGGGVKVALHHQGDQTTHRSVDRKVTLADIDSMRGLLMRFLPRAHGEFLRGAVCLYTNTPDGHFILDFHPDTDRVILASPCSGHGFKFASAIGEVLADLVTRGGSSRDLSLFRVGRFL